MQVNGDSGKYKVSSNPILSKTHKANPSFSGHTLTKDERGNDVVKFYLPNAGTNVKVQYTLLERTDKGHFIVAPNTTITKQLNSNGMAQIAVDEMLNDSEMAIGYRFLLENDVPYLDYVKKVALNGNVFNVATPAYRAGHMLPRQMEHVLPDSVVPDINDEKRNHFNHLGGSIGSIIDKIDYFKDFGVKRILGTPIFGQDTVSSHGYWTTNGYQVTNTLGDMSEFKKLQTELFKKDMGWVADGAFVNEGWQGIHIKDILVHGEDSPFLNWFETKGIKDYGVKIGVLSKEADADKHTRIKVINAKYKIEYEPVKEPDGTISGFKEKQVINNKNYDARKPTYIQMFDERLVDVDQVNSDEPFEVYARKNAPDKHEIYNYKNAVQPYFFRVVPKDADKNYEKYEEALNEFKKAKGNQADKPQIKNYLTQWSNFELVPSNKAGGITTWVGNTDIPKKRFMAADNVYEGKTGEEFREIEAAQYQVQDDTVQIGKFWTSEVARTLVEYASEEIAKEYDKTLDYNKAVQNLIKEKKLPESASMILEKNNGSSPLENVLKVLPTGERGYKLKPTAIPQNVTDGLMSYPLDAIEFSPDLSSIMAYPFLKNYAVTQNTVGLSRYEMYQMGDKYYEKMPARFREIYRDMDNFIAGTKDGNAKSNMTDYTIELLKAAGNEAGFKIVDEEGNLTSDGKDIYSVLAPDIAKFIYVSSINPSVKPEYKNNHFTYDTKELQKTTIESLGLELAATPEQAAERLLGKMKIGLASIPEGKRKEFVKYLASKAINLDSDTVSVARLIIEQAEAGLDWRIDAAKDVGDWDGVDKGTVNEQKCLNSIADFWKNFNDGVRKYNPKAYTIGELTDLAGEFEETFCNRTGFTTDSNYKFLYSSPFQLYSAEFSDAGDINHRSDISEKIANLLIEQDGGGYLHTRLADSVNFSHVFMGNHDKPRVLHMLAANLDIYKDDKAGAKIDVFKRAFDHSADFNNNIGHFRGLLEGVLKDMSNGKYYYKGTEKKFDSENFGAMPYDMSIDDMFLQACQKEPKFAEYVQTNPEKVKLIKAKLLETMLSPAMTKNESMTFFQVGMPGTPTIYAGDELGETGWETSSKNETQDNRNRLHFERLTDDNYAFVKRYHDEMKNIINIRNQKAASALVDGTTIPLTGQKMNGADSGTAAVVYRYNDKTDAICVFHNDGYSKDPESRGVSRTINEIRLEQSDLSKSGLPYALKDGTIYYNALNPKERYKIVTHNNVAKIVNTLGGAPIDLNVRGIILLREKGYNGEEYVRNIDGKAVVSFRGRAENAHVKLANTRFSIG